MNCGKILMLFAVVFAVSCAESVDPEKGPRRSPPKPPAERPAPGAEKTAPEKNVVPDGSILPQHAEWELTFRDEFDGDALDRNVWASSEGYRPPENNVVADGVLHQTTRHHKDPNAKYQWTMAHIRTREFTQQYGYFEARMKYAPYHNNAFWLWRPSQIFREEPHFEIDINEGHIPDEIRMTLHFFTYPDGPGKPGELHSSGRHVNVGGALDREWHVYGCEWNEKEIVFYFDGKPLHRIANPICHAPADVRFSTKLDHGEVRRFGKKAEEVADGVSMDIDWVRVWRKKKDLAAPEYPLPLTQIETERFEQSEPRVKSVPANLATTFTEDFESLTGELPTAWRIANGKPEIVEREGRRMLALPKSAYVFCMLPRTSAGVFEVVFDMSQEERRDGLLFVTLGKFDDTDPLKLADSYFAGDIGIYAWWSKYFLNYYMEPEKFIQIYRRKNDGRWHRYRFVLDVKNGVFDVFGGPDLREFLCSGRFRHNQKAAHGIGFMNRRGEAPVFIDNVTVRQ